MLTPLSSSAGGSSSSTSMDVDDTASSNDGFALLRAALYRGLQREVRHHLPPTTSPPPSSSSSPPPSPRPQAPPCPPHETLQSRWRPYLCALLTLLEALGAITLQPGDLYGEVEDLLLLLGLPAEFGRDEAGALTLVFERCVRHAFLHTLNQSKHSALERAVNSPLTVICLPAWLPAMGRTCGCLSRCGAVRATGGARSSVWRRRTWPGQTCTTAPR